MSRMKHLIVLSVLIAMACGQATNETEDTKPRTTTTTTTTTTVAPTTPSTTTTTVAPPATTTTTAAPTTTSTAAPTTTSTAAPNTTTAPTTTVAPTTPGPQPKPVDPDTGDWQVDYPAPDTGVCIKAKMALQVEFHYITKSNNLMTAYVDVPKNSTASGSCGNMTQNIKLSWNNDSINFIFKLNGTKYHLDLIEITVVPDSTFVNMNNTSPIVVNYAIEEFKTTEEKSYKCDYQKFNLTSTKDVPSAFIYITHLQYQAFTNATGFADAIDCKPFDTPDIIPIAAGIALGILIAFILIGYLVGRRRSQARGYLSMFTQTKREEDYIPMKNLSCFN